GLGSALLPYLVGAGVGRVTICDGDTVSVSNLHRQTLFREGDVGKNKAEIAAETLRQLNSDVAIEALPRHLSVSDTLEGYTLACACVDSFEARRILSSLCVQHSVPMVSGSAQGWSLHVQVYPSLSLSVS
ncbi:hypothetical protein KIPB_011987, partial [Kipferlia bialata]